MCRLTSLQSSSRCCRRKRFSPTPIVMCSVGKIRKWVKSLIVNFDITISINRELCVKLKLISDNYFNISIKTSNREHFLYLLQGQLTDNLMQFDVKTRDRETCLAHGNFPFATICSSQTTTELDKCVGEDGSALICDGELRAIVSKDCVTEGVTQYTDVSQVFNWIWLSHLDQTLKMIDNDTFKYIIFGVLDFVAYYINTPKIADDFEVLKYFF